MTTQFRKFLVILGTLILTFISGYILFSLDSGEAILILLPVFLALIILVAIYSYIFLKGILIPHPPVTEPAMEPMSLAPEPITGSKKRGRRLAMLMVLAYIFLAYIGARMPGSSDLVAFIKIGFVGAVGTAITMGIVGLFVFPYIFRMQISRSRARWLVTLYFLTPAMLSLIYVLRIMQQ